MVKLSIGVINKIYEKKKISIAQVAIIQETGTDTIPPRPAFTIGLNQSVQQHKKLIDATLKNISTHILTGRKSSIERNLTQMLTQIGRSAKKKIKELIKGGNMTPGNAPSTIVKKGFDHPLWEKGELHDSVDYLVDRE